MLKTSTSKWTACLLSLAVPGTGQLLAGSATAFGWFLTAGLATVVAVAMTDDSPAALVYCVQFSLWLMLGTASAWHALQLMETRSPWQRSRGSTSTVVCDAGSGRAIKAKIVIATNLSQAQLWRRIRRLEDFLTIDPFHEQVTLMRDQPAQGVDVVLHHNAFGRRFPRFGRILWWREGEGFAISDLSSRNPHAGFPHVFTYHIESSGDTASLHIDITGRWTSRLVPTWLGRIWIRLICRYHAMLLTRAL